jgi:HEAT repeat protein
MQNDKWLIRHSAISSLKFSNDQVAEAALIEMIEKSDDPHNLTYANATLNNMGSLKAIPYLEKHTRSRKRDVKLSAQLAIEAITKRYGQ